MYSAHNIYAISFFIPTFSSTFKILEKQLKTFLRFQKKFDLEKEPILNDFSFPAGFIIKKIVSFMHFLSFLYIFFCALGALVTDTKLSKIYMLALAGPRWGKYVVGPLQFGICYGAVVAGSLLGGQSLKVSCVSLPWLLLWYSYIHFIFLIYIFMF